MALSLAVPSESEKLSARTCFGKSFPTVLALSHFTGKIDLSWVSRKVNLNGAQMLSRNKRKQILTSLRRRRGKEERKKKHTRKKASKSQVLLKVQAIVFIASSPVSLALENLQFSLG